MPQEGIMHLKGANYYFVNENHPAVRLLYQNQEALGTKIDENDKVNGEWYRIEQGVFEQCISALLKDVLNKTPEWHDLSNFTIRIKRPDNKSWLDYPGMLHDEHIDDPVIQK